MHPAWMILWLGLAASPASALPAAQPASAASQASVSIALGAPSRGFEDLIALWNKRAAAMEAKDEGHLEDLMGRLIAAGREVGISRMMPFAGAAVADASVALEEGDLERARALVSQAERLDSGLPALYDVQASLALAERAWAVHLWAKFKVKAFIARVDDFRRSMLLTGDILLTLLTILAMLALIFAFTQGARYAVNVYHDLGHAFPTGIRALLVASLVALGVMPLLYGFGPLLLLFPLAALIWGYQSRGERLFSVLLVLFLGASPWLLRAADRLMDAGTGTTQALYALDLNPTDRRALSVVEGAARDEADWQARTVLGIAYKRQGRFEDAERQLSGALRGTPADSAARGVVHNALGNVFFALGRAEPAKRAYERAEVLLSGNAEPPFNLYRLNLRTGTAAAAQASLERASAIDAQRVAAWAADTKTTVNRHVADVAFPRSVLVSRAVGGLFQPTALSRQTWVALAGPVPEMVAPVSAALSLVLFIAFVALGRRVELAWPCARCGASARFMVGDGQPVGVNCDDCVDLFVRNLPMNRRLRFAKEERVARVQSYRRWGTRLAGLTLPGLSDLLTGRAFRGVVLVGLSLFIVVRVLQPAGILVEPGALPAVEVPTHFVWAGFGGLLWLLNLRSVFRRTREVV